MASGVETVKDSTDSLALGDSSETAVSLSSGAVSRSLLTGVSRPCWVNSSGLRARVKSGDGGEFLLLWSLKYFFRAYVC
jgi:hypothetical protein